MQATNPAVLDQALAMPVEERLRLVDALLESLNAPASEEIDRQWKEEAERRVSEIQAGEARLLDGEEVFARLRANYRT